MEANPVKKVCQHCGSDDVHADAYADWNAELQMWEVASVFDKGAFCNKCTEPCIIETVDITE